MATNDITLSQPNSAIVNPAIQAQSDDLAMIRQKAQLLVESSFLPDAIDTWQKAAVIMMRGRELNVPDWTALQHISIVHGNPGVDGQLALALVLRSGLCEEYVILRSDTMGCTIRMKRKGQSAFDCTCTMDEASTMKTVEGKGDSKRTVSLTESYGWKQQPKTHLFYFTAKQITKRLFSDVLNGMAGNKAGDLPIEEAENEYVDSEYGDSGIGQTPEENPTSASPELQPEEPISEGELVEEPQLPDAFDASFPPIGIPPTETPVRPTIGSLNMDSLWLRSHVNPRSAFDALVLNLRKTRKISDAMTADQVIDAIRASQAAAAFSMGEAGGVAE